jgi:hypothetical protein
MKYLIGDDHVINIIKYGDQKIAISVDCTTIGATPLSKIYDIDGIGKVYLEAGPMG